MSGWLTVLIMGWLLVIVPGPNFVMTLRNSLLMSRRAGLLTAMGIALGGMTHVTYSLIGIGVVISQSVLLFNALKWLGTLYLIYNGIKGALSHRPIGENMGDAPGRSHAMRQGFLTCLLNPKSTLFFFALFTQVIQPGTPLPVRVFFGLTIVVSQAIWYSFVALVLSHQTIRHSFLSVSHWIERLTGTAMIGLGIRLALTHADT